MASRDARRASHQNARRFRVDAREEQTDPSRVRRVARGDGGCDFRRAIGKTVDGAREVCARQGMLLRVATPRRSTHEAVGRRRTTRRARRGVGDVSRVAQDTPRKQDGASRGSCRRARHGEVTRSRVRRRLRRVARKREDVARASSSARKDVRSVASQSGRERVSEVDRSGGGGGAVETIGGEGARSRVRTRRRRGVPSVDRRARRRRETTTRRGAGAAIRREASKPRRSRRAQGVGRRHQAVQEGAPHGGEDRREVVAFGARGSLRVLGSSRRGSAEGAPRGGEDRREMVALALKPSRVGLIASRICGGSAAWWRRSPRDGRVWRSPKPSRVGLIASRICGGSAAWWRRSPRGGRVWRSQKPSRVGLIASRICGGSAAWWRRSPRGGRVWRSQKPSRVGLIASRICGGSAAWWRRSPRGGRVWRSQKPSRVSSRRGSAEGAPRGGEDRREVVAFGARRSLCMLAQDAPRKQDGASRGSCRRARHGEVTRSRVRRRLRRVARKREDVARASSSARKDVRSVASQSGRERVSEVDRSGGGGGAVETIGGEGARSRVRTRRRRGVPSVDRRARRRRETTTRRGAGAAIRREASKPRRSRRAQGVGRRHQAVQERAPRGGEDRREMVAFGARGSLRALVPSRRDVPKRTTGRGQDRASFESPSSRERVRLLVHRRGVTSPRTRLCDSRGVGDGSPLASRLFSPLARRRIRATPRRSRASSRRGYARASLRPNPRAIFRRLDGRGGGSCASSPRGVSSFASTGSSDGLCLIFSLARFRRRGTSRQETLREVRATRRPRDCGGVVRSLEGNPRAHRAQTPRETRGGDSRRSRARRRVRDRVSRRAEGTSARVFGMARTRRETRPRTKSAR